MPSLTIRHTHEEGTLLEGSRKGDGVYEIVRRHGFAYFPSIRAIGIRGSRDQVAQRYRINVAAEALRAAGHEVEVDIDDTPRERATVLADQAERLDDRADRLTVRAIRHQAASDAAYNRASDIAARFEGGQPILVGHHSERKARRDQEKIARAMDKSVAEQRTADHLAHAASRVGTQLAYSERPTVTARRIKTTESELRIIQRNLDGYTRRHLDHHGNPYYVENHEPATGDYREQLLARQALLTEKLRYDQAALEQAQAAGTFVAWGPHNVHVGDTVRYWGGVREVAKVNKVTVSVPSNYSWMDKLKFTDIKEVVCPHNQPAVDPHPLEPAEPDHPADATDVEAERRERRDVRMTASLDRISREAAETAQRLGITFPKPTVRSHGLVGEGATVEASRATRTAERDAAIAAAIAAPPVFATGYFPTPRNLADRIIREHTNIAAAGAVTVLEPSAGDGALVRAVLAANPAARVVAVEPNGQLAALIGPDEPGRLTVHRQPFEDYATTDTFGYVVMNPPFSAPRRLVLWAEHVLRAYDYLAPGGRLVAIVPAGLEYRVDRKIRRMRDLAAEHGGWEALPEGAFVTSGTQVRTVVVWIDRPQPDPSEVEREPAPAAEQLSLLDTL